MRIDILLGMLLCASLAAIFDSSALAVFLALTASNFLTVTRWIQSLKEMSAISQLKWLSGGAALWLMVVMLTQSYMAGMAKFDGLTAITISAVYFGCLYVLGNYFTHKVRLHFPQSATA